MNEILGELYRGGLLNEDVSSVHTPTLREWLSTWDIHAESPSPEAIELCHAAPGGVRTIEAFSTTNRWSSLDTDAMIRVQLPTALILLAVNVLLLNLLMFR